MGERRLAKSRRAEDQGVVQRFATFTRRFDKYLHLFFNGILSHKVPYQFRP